MTYLNKYVEKIREEGNTYLAKSIEENATEVGQKYISQFDYRSNQIGLLLGNVQSGKTGQVFGIASKAVDLGFPYFILLTTDNTLLQTQTFERAKRDLTEFIVCNENEEQKFRNSGNKPTMLVLKKNTRVLNAWVNRFKNMQILVGNPLFIIDDEADAASLNTKVNTKEMSSINKYLNEIRDTAIGSIYLQVTGTPQALLLQSLDSSWKPLFTYYFEPGKRYLGGNFFFPTTDTVPEFVRFIDQELIDNTIYEVVVRHLVVSAQVLLTDGKVSNCLIHPGVRQALHEEVKSRFETVLMNLKDDLEQIEFKELIKKEYLEINPRNSEKVPFEDLLKKIYQIFSNDEYQLVLLNGASSDNSTNYEVGCNFIIGGTTLGRGVTFKQLNTFYYTRTSKSPQADTMWQHSRMFGYDRDPGLISMFCSRELYQLFTQINETNNSIINQAKNGSNITIAYSDKIKPTRSNVLDKSLLNILAGGSNHFPLNPKNNTFEQITDLVAGFKDSDPAIPINLGLMVKILEHFDAEESFNMDGYKNIIESIRKTSPTTQGRLLVRRGRDISFGKRALLSPNDWEETNNYHEEFVLTLYQVIGTKEKGWHGHPLWIPNIKLPTSRDFYLIN